MSDVGGANVLLYRNFLFKPFLSAKCRPCDGIQVNSIYAHSGNLISAMFSTKQDRSEHTGKLCYSIEVWGSNEICRTTLELKTDSNVELLHLHVWNKYFWMKIALDSKTLTSIKIFSLSTLYTVHASNQNIKMKYNQKF